MSHFRERKEKVCLNCNAIVAGRYCQDCGQENVVPKQSLWHLITHFFNDFTHFDGKFFSTLRPLVLRPGFLSKEYVQGRRIKYLDPIRMYIFISAVFLLFLLSLLEIPGYVNNKNPGLIRTIDSFRVAAYENDAGVISDDVNGYELFVLNLPEKMRHGQAYYDSVAKAQPDSASHNIVTKYMIKRAIGMYQAYDIDPLNFLPKVLDKFVHSISKIFFISLPLFAFLLSILYIRRRTQFYFVSHAIFSLHYYSVCFLFILVILGLSELTEDYSFSDAVVLPLWILGLYTYLYIAMLRFYGQHWFKTLIKSLLLYSLSAVLILTVTLIVFLNSFLSVGLH